MSNLSKKRKRTEKIEFYVYPEEKLLIEKKMELSKHPNMSSYLRQAACYNKVVVYNYDFGDFKKIGKELNSIGVNINQLVARVNSTDNVYQEDLNYLKEMVQKIWHTLQSILSNLP